MGIFIFINHIVKVLYGFIVVLQIKIDDASKIVDAVIFRVISDDDVEVKSAFIKYF